ncbi:bifunctional DNA-binding transcriptional regulator/O6-methylguanine-DNA methyltransferase Ada [Aromatoleum toluvorans]|nr:bifunctional DNA-binding transcriptional regulator/O6-methylguanine-DNA methyltransferase Ada [Aromatoleum toluvorans]
MKMSRQIEMRAATTTADPRWAAVQARDARADGQFCYAVRTTGVYCRPSCAARLPRPENVEFFATAAEAAGAGYRPCRRCSPSGQAPSQQQAEMVAGLCRQIALAERPPTLEELARAANLSPFHVHRVFKAVTGTTPRAYARACRAARMKATLNEEETVTGAIYAAGYGSSGRFYEEAGRTLGMSAGSYRAGGARQQIRFAVGECSLGAILVASTERGVCAILIDDDPDVLVRDLQDRFPRADLIGGDADYERVVATVVGFVEAPGLGLDLPLDVRGTAFQMRVWQALQAIPAGETVTYTDIANRIGAPKAVRAVAGACAANRLAVAIPCHRVVRSDGGLSGYRWGVERKRRLLAREAAR